MSKVEISTIGKPEHDELCCTYASLLLKDAEQEVTEESLKKIIDASGNKVDAMWTKLFAKALKGTDLSNFFGCAAAAPAAGSSAAPAVAKETKKAEKKEEPKEEPKEDEGDMDMGGLFDF